MKPTQSSSSGQSGQHDVSPREREVLQWLAEGVSSADVARRLGKPPQAVRAHVAKLMQQLRAATPAEALRRLNHRHDAHHDDESNDDESNDDESNSDEQDASDSIEAFGGDGNTTEAAAAARPF